MAKKLNTDNIEEATVLSYFDNRMQILGITPENNKIGIFQTQVNEGKHSRVMNELPIFREVDLGIEIIVYTLERLLINYKPEGSRWSKNFSIIRLKDPVVKGNDVMKYRLPKGGGTYPFFPPGLIEKFEKKQPIKTIFLVEGYFKAFKASMCGVDIIGLSSITHMKDKDKGKLHEDILKLMLTCNVERMVWLTDGDCLDITQKELTDGIDLYKRPKGFFQSIQTFKTLLDDYQDVEKWFVHIDTDTIIQAGENKGTTRDLVKGIDDLLCTLPKKVNDIVEDLNSVSKGGFYFQKFNITYGLSKVLKHFHLSDVKDFYLFHVERRPELKDKEFIFNGTRYKYNEETGDCDVRIPAAANLYFRVADHYYKFLNLPNQYKQLEKVFHERKKTTILDDHGKNFCKHVPKYEAFCNVPDHVTFQQVINNCFNVYSPLDFSPEEEECTAEDCPTIIKFLTHIFGEKMASFTHPDTGKKIEYKNLDIALDYLQIIYQQPWRKLPIICLVSKENNTGKSTFANFLRMMLGSNVAIVGNADLAGDFNAHWATKNVVICDETKIDKQHVIEKIKSLSTAKKIFMNAKGRGQVELDCFLKFVLITNNEESFITLSDNDIRYWVLKVPELKSENPHIVEQFVEEMPAFLSFLNKRTLATENRNRMWFHPQLLKTEALKKVIAYSQPTIEKELRQYFKELFLDTGLDEILMTQKVVHKEVFNNKYERNYLSNVLTNNLKVEPLHKWKVEGMDYEYTTIEEAKAAAQGKYPDIQGYMIEGKLYKHYKVTRYSYPKFIENFKDGKAQMDRVEMSDNGRPLVFKRKDFLKPEEMRSVDTGAENKFLSETMAPVQGDLLSDEDLPF